MEVALMFLFIACVLAGLSFVASQQYQLSLEQVKIYEQIAELAKLMREQLEKERSQ